MQNLHFHVQQEIFGDPNGSNQHSGEIRASIREEEGEEEKGRRQQRSNHHVFGALGPLPYPKRVMCSDQTSSIVEVPFKHDDLPRPIGRLERLSYRKLSSSVCGSERSTKIRSSGYHEISCSDEIYPGEGGRRRSTRSVPSSVASPLRSSVRSSPSGESRENREPPSPSAFEKKENTKAKIRSKIEVTVIRCRICLTPLMVNWTDKNTNGDPIYRKYDLDRNRSLTVCGKCVEHSLLYG